MKTAVNAEYMKKADDNTSAIFKLPSIVLMERAALSVVSEIETRFPKNKKIAILCGSGNNGGDGFAIGRILNERGYCVHFFMIENSNKGSDANLLQRSILEAYHTKIRTELPNDEYDIILDSLFGTGLSRELKDTYFEWIEHLNKLNGFKIAVDVPSGLNSDYGTILGTCFRADLTITFAFQKLGTLLYPGREYCGEVIVKDIGITKEAFLDDYPNFYCLDKNDITDLLPKRIPNSHKGTYKKAGIIAGSKEIGGAVYLSTLACMNMGVGYTKVLTHSLNRDYLLQSIPEALYYFYDNHQYNDLLDCEAIGIGPGLTVSDESYSLVKNILNTYDGKLIIDADAINLIAKHEELFEMMISYAKKHLVVLTPHKKEFSRLAHITMDIDPSKQYGIEEQFSKKYNINLICKDASSRIYTTDGNIYINTSGNNGMATAGSGDVLTGILTGLLSQSDDLRMVPLGAYLHGLSGDIALTNSNAYSLKATDLCQSLLTILKEK